RALRMQDVRGRWQVRDDGIAVLATVHPSWLLRLPEAGRRAAWPGFVADLARLAPALQPAGEGLSAGRTPACAACAPRAWRRATRTKPRWRPPASGPPAPRGPRCPGGCGARW